MPSRNLLVLSQVFVPDPAAVGQYMFDAAEALVREGWRVKVYAAERGYDDPRRKYPVCESIHGVHIKRLPWSSFGKQSIPLRLLGQLSFVVQCFLRGVFSRRLDAILVTTSPPMGGVVAWAIALFRRVPIHFWVMDINPDQAVRLGAFPETHPFVRIFNLYMKGILRKARSVIALDHYMADRLRSKTGGGRSPKAEGSGQWAEGSGQEQRNDDSRFSDRSQADSRLFVLPPWPMDDYLEPVAPEENPFRIKHGLGGKTVFLYSGNHSLAHPIATFLEAAARLKEDPRAAFLFVGGGKRKEEVEEAARAHGAANLHSLPYQPLDRIRYSLSAGDIHLVSMGGEMVGCVHPCKFYSALVLGKPILYLGPRRSHIGDLLAEHDIGWRIDHGDVAGMEALYREILASPPEKLQKKGARARHLVENGPFQREKMLREFVEIVESAPQARCRTTNA
ncbi:MAG: glycosyltransferase family 4 protein [Puniceicoccaceae bacterium]